MSAYRPSSSVRLGGKSRRKKAFPWLWVGLASAGLLLLALIGGGLWLLLPMLTGDSNATVADATSTESAANTEVAAAPSTAPASNAGNGTSPAAANSPPGNSSSTASGRGLFEPNRSAEYQLVRKSVDLFDSLTLKLSLLGSDPFRSAAERDLQFLDRQLAELEQLWETQSVAALAAGLIETNRMALSNSMVGLDLSPTARQTSSIGAEIAQRAKRLGDKWLAKIDSALSSDSALAAGKGSPSQPQPPS